MDCRLCTLSILTFIALKISLASSQPSEAADAVIDDPSLLESKADDFRLGDLYSLSPDDTEEFDKRRSLMRFGKRRSLMRFGKRGSILRFGKRGSLMRFGKRYGYDSEDLSNYEPAYLYDFPGEYDPTDEFGEAKRGSLMRFGKKSSIMRFGRSIAARQQGKSKAHTPWRFGREEDELL